MKTVTYFLVLISTMIPGIVAAQLHDHENERRGFYDYSTRRYYNYSYGGHSHLERMADQLWNAANAVCWEAHNNYQHERGFRETYREMYKLLQDSKHIKKLIHDSQYHPQPGLNDHIARDLHEVDELMHHIQDDVRRWHRDLHRHDDYHSGHDHSVDRVYGHGDIKEKLGRLEHTVHHLMEDYGVKSKMAPPPGPTGGSGDPPPPSDFGGPPPRLNR